MRLLELWLLNDALGGSRLNPKAPPRGDPPRATLPIRPELLRIAVRRRHRVQGEHKSLFRGVGSPTCVYTSGMLIQS